MNYSISATAAKFFKVVNIEERKPPLMKFVPTIDDNGEIIMYRRTEHGYNMRDSEGTNSPNNNHKIVSWLEPLPLTAIREDAAYVINKLINDETKSGSCDNELGHKIAMALFEEGLMAFLKIK